MPEVRGMKRFLIPIMMLFWAGLRGAVGVVALAAGFKGDNATTLRTTVLVVVVISVLVFGGTTARMLEVLGIRTVEDEAASSDDEYAPLPFSPREGRNVWLGRRDTPPRSAPAYLTTTSGYTALSLHGCLSNPLDRCATLLQPQYTQGCLHTLLLGL